MRYNAAGKVVLLLALVAAAGCDELVDLEPEEVVVRAAHTFPPVSGPTVDFTVSVEIDNFSLRTLYVETSCGWVIEKLVSGVWVPAYDAPCPATPAFVEIERETTAPLTFAAAVAQRVDDDAIPPGTYRIRLSIEASYSRLRRQEVPEPSRTSNAFNVL